MAIASDELAAGRPGGRAPDRRTRSLADLGPHYKWIALSNTTLGMLIATINSSIVLIALPDIFKGININPLDPSNTSYLLWMMMGFLVVTAVLVVSFGRMGDMFGRAKMYNLGFAVFTISSIFLAVTWMNGSSAALWLIGWRIIQGIGGAFLMANSSAILTDAFPANQRGLAMGFNGVAAIAGSFLGLVIGGLLSPVNWHLIFLVSVPVGVLGTIWAYIKLHDIGERQRARMDWWGNITFAIGLIAVLVAITYGIQPYGGKSMGWTNPWVLGALVGGVIVLIIFGIIETRVANPLFNLSLFKIRSFAFGNLANLTASLGRGGLQFILIIWLQGIWLPQHGYSFASTPLWAGIYMLPMTVGFLLSAPLSGVLSDKLGTRVFAAVGMFITALTFVALIIIPVNFSYVAFAAILLFNGLGMGMFAAPNRAEVMNSLPGNARGAGAGMTATFQNAAMVLSIGVFFSLIIAGLSAHLPSALSSGLVAHGVPANSAAQIASLPAVGVLFAAFLGYNPIQQLLGSTVHTLPAAQVNFLTGRSFFPSLISGPFADGLTVAFIFAIVACVIGAIASLACKPAPILALEQPAEDIGTELAGIAGELVDEDPFEVPASINGFRTNGHGVHEFGTELGGTVFGDGGAPAAGAVITVTSPTGQQIERASVGTDGGYRLTGLRPGGYTVIASARGFAPQALAAHVATSQPARRDFVLAGAGAVGGTVRSARQGPGVPDATVIVTDATGTVVGQSTSTQRGEYRISGVPDGVLTVTADASGHQPAAAQVSVHGGPVTVDLVLAAVGGVLGAVRSTSGRPLAGATLTAVDADGRVAATVVADETGQYRLEGLPDGQYTVVANLYQPMAQPIRIGPGQVVEQDVTLRPHGD
ncbi:MAG TPA: MFS transporter [Pseudonocardiaceae bacterium]|nr:MFS transporter [Pseudonocardiaceae bacterium]